MNHNIADIDQHPLAGVFTFGAVLGTLAFGFDQTSIIFYGVAANIVSGIGAAIGGLLDDILGSDGKALDAVILLKADPDELVRRLLNRAQEQGRADDTEEVIRRRLEVYEEQTAPLTALYKSRGLLVQVDGLGSVEDVTARISAALNS